MPAGFHERFLLHLASRAARAHAGYHYPGRFGVYQGAYYKVVCAFISVHYVHFGKIAEAVNVKFGLVGVFAHGLSVEHGLEV